MNPRVLIVQNEETDPPALVAKWLKSAGIDLDIVRGYNGEQIPTSVPVEYDGVIALGGYMSANDDDEHAWLTEERSLLTDVVANDIPFFGICLGGQMLATAVGGVVEKSPNKEIGISHFTVSESMADDKVFAPLAGKDVIAAQWHVDYISDLPDDVHVFAGNDVCPVQAYKVGHNVYGAQFHPEIDEEVFGWWIDESIDYLEGVGMDPKQVSDEISAAALTLVETWKPVFENWANLVKAQQAHK